LRQKMATLREKLDKNPLARDPRLDELLALYQRKVQLGNEIKALKKAIKQATAITQMEELRARKRVLRRYHTAVCNALERSCLVLTDLALLHCWCDGRLGYTTANDVIELKGRVACEISTGDELLLTEMIFNGAFNNLTVEQTVALLSCFVFEEKVRPGSSAGDTIWGRALTNVGSARCCASGL